MKEHLLEDLASIPSISKKLKIRFLFYLAGCFSNVEGINKGDLTYKYNTLLDLWTATLDGRPM